MHAARFDNSERLQRLAACLRRRGGSGATTDEIRRDTGSVCVHSDVSELRANGFTVDCSFEGLHQGRRVYRYTLTSEPGQPARHDGPSVAEMMFGVEEDDGPLVTQRECLARMREALR